jgi:O-antigen/teichoic acid export membrane protein
VTAAGTNLALGLLLIPPFGVYGAIVARVAGALVRSLIVVHISRKMTDAAMEQRETACEGQ